MKSKFLHRTVPRNFSLTELFVDEFLLVIVERSSVTLYFERRCISRAVFMAGWAKHGLNFRKVEWVRRAE